MSMAADFTLAMRDFSTDLRLLTSPLRVLPDFVIPGEAKCGTTSFYRYLLQHPSITGSDRKEPKNFIEYPHSRLYCRSHYTTYISRIIRQIVKFRKELSGEATAEYFSRTLVASRIRRLVPEVKIIILLRNPVQRAYSDYQMLKRIGAVEESFRRCVERSVEWLKTPSLSDLIDAAMESEHFYLRFVARGIYVSSIVTWMENFPEKRLLILRSEDLFEHTESLMDKSFNFLGVKNYKVRIEEVKRKGEYQIDMDGDVKTMLGEFYQPFNERLYEVIGRDMNWGNG